MDDIDLYCPVCDRRLDPSTLAAHPQPPPPPPAASAALPSPPLAQGTAVAPSTSATSSRSGGHGHGHAATTKMRRSHSSHSNQSAGSAATTAASTKGQLKRNKSSGRLHHGHTSSATKGYGRGHGLHSLAPLAPADTGAGKGKKGSSRASGKVKEEIIEVIDEPAPPAQPVASTSTSALTAPEPAPTSTGNGMYCSAECRMIDEARNQLHLAHLTGQPLVPSPEIELLQRSQSRSQSQTDLAALHPFDAMTRRRSSGLSSASSYSHALSSASGVGGGSSRGGLSPIFSAHPTANPAPFDHSAAFPFPPQPPPPARSASAASSLPSHYARPPLSATSSSLPPGAPANLPPMLNFAARRKSRGAESLSSYPYRPSLLERVASTDALPSYGAGRGEEPAKLGKDGRSLSLNTGLSRAERTRSVEHLAGLSERLATGRPPSALASFRSMTPISPTSSTSNPSTSSPHRPSASTSGSGTGSRSSSRSRSATRARTGSRSRSRSNTLESETGTEYPEVPTRRPSTTGKFFVGSAPTPSALVGTGRGPSFGEPTLADASSPLPAPTPRPLILQRSQRSASSASLALMGSSLGRSFTDQPRPWAPRRSESVASLSGFVARGEMASPSLGGAGGGWGAAEMGGMPPVSTSSVSTVIPASASTSSLRHPPPPRSHSASAYSPSSTSSYGAHSTFSHHSSGSGRGGVGGGGTGSSTGGSSTDLTSHSHHSHHSHPYNPILSTSGSSRGSSTAGGGGAGSALKRGGSISRSRKSLLMTPSLSSTNLASSSAAQPALPAGAGQQPSLLPPPIAPTPANAAALNPSLSYLKPAPSSASPTPHGAPHPPPSAPPVLGAHSRTFSWDRLSAAEQPALYPVYDVDAFRASRAGSRAGSRAEKRGEGETEKRAAGAGGAGEGEGAMLPPPVPRAKERKRLFYFSDQSGAGEEH
ncbi:hypothetical protein JCM10207_005769 [Rhodosporidiobolus poonsookiae]